MHDVSIRATVCVTKQCNAPSCVMARHVRPLERACGLSYCNAAQKRNVHLVRIMPMCVCTVCALDTVNVRRAASDDYTHKRRHEGEFDLNELVSNEVRVAERKRTHRAFGVVEFSDESPSLATTLRASATAYRPQCRDPSGLCAAHCIHCIYIVCTTSIVCVVCLRD